MKHCELDELGKSIQAAWERFEAGAPMQSERHGDVELRWWAIWIGHSGGPRERLKYTLATVDEQYERITGEQPVSIRREEIRAELERWMRNEGDWPLARKEQP
jgi:hypothetical protein